MQIISLLQLYDYLYQRGKKIFLIGVYTGGNFGFFYSKYKNKEHYFFSKNISQ